uniref:Uncharacterized protein n=1 Tax=Romanomermis culicivorax TaxID=13658 RepID=A0A915KX14_ROMCU
MAGSGNGSDDGECEDECEPLSAETSVATRIPPQSDECEPLSDTTVKTAADATPRPPPSRSVQTTTMSNNQVDGCEGEGIHNMAHLLKMRFTTLPDIFTDECEPLDNGTPGSSVQSTVPPSNDDADECSDDDENTENDCIPLIFKHQVRNFTVIILTDELYLHFLNLLISISQKVVFLQAFWQARWAISSNPAIDVNFGKIKIQESRMFFRIHNKKNI